MEYKKGVIILEAGDSFISPDSPIAKEIKVTYMGVELVVTGIIIPTDILIQKII